LMLLMWPSLAFIQNYLEKDNCLNFVHPWRRCTLLWLSH
jgi:hypothetical protein